ncbi:MAG: aminotransferase class I/II-fold pyridoxal phosphate-dependent enzyme [Pseudomonadota bacterium]
MLQTLTRYFRRSLVVMTPTPTVASLVGAPSPVQAYPFTVESARQRCTFNGTVAISQVVQLLGLREGDRVLLPAYVCGSELGPFEHAGCVLAFYRVHPNLQIDLADLERALETPTRAVLLTHYFGFPQRDTARARALCDAAGAALIEDCAHALFSTDGAAPVGQIGDYAVFSPRKSLPLADGGLVVGRQALADTPAWPARRPPLLPTLDRVVYGLQQSARAVPGAGGGGRLAIAALLPFAVAIKALRRLVRLPDWAWATADVEGPAAVPFYPCRMSWYGARALRRVDASSVVTARRRHYRQWARALADVDGVSLLFDTLPDGVCPLYCPILVDAPDALVANLAADDVEVFRWWPHLHPAIAWAEHPALVALKARSVALPVHQQLTPEQIDVLAARLRAAVSETANAAVNDVHTDTHVSDTPEARRAW